MLNPKKKRAHRELKTVFHVTRTRLATAKKGHNQTKHVPKAVEVQSKRQMALEMRIEGHSEHDIAESLGVSQQRVSQYLTDILMQKAALTEAQAPIARELELERIDRMTLAWYKKAKIDPRASEVLLKWIERKHKIQGLDISKTQLMGEGGGPIRINASAIDITRLDDEELQWLERIIKKAGPSLPKDGDKLPALEHKPKAIDDEE